MGGEPFRGGCWEHVYVTALIPGRALLGAVPVPASTPRSVPLLSPLRVSSRLYASSLCCRQGDSFQVNLPIPTFSVPPYVSANLSFECLISTIVVSIVKHSMGLFFKYATLFPLFLIATFTFSQFHSYLTSVRGLSSVQFLSLSILLVLSCGGVFLGFRGFLNCERILAWAHFVELLWASVGLLSPQKDLCCGCLAPGLCQ